MGGLQHVHEHDLLHRDLKPANIFLSKDGIIKIGDFGLSRDLDSPNIPHEDLLTYATARNGRHMTILRQSAGNQTYSVGTPGYVAPEILNNESYGPKIDVYSLGIVFMEMFTKTVTKHERGKNLM